MKMFLAITLNIEEVGQDGTVINEDTDDINLSYALDSTLYLPYSGPQLVRGDVIHPLTNSLECEAVVTHTDVVLVDNYATIEASVAYALVDHATVLDWYRDLRAHGWQFLEEMQETHIRVVKVDGACLSN